MKPVGSKSHAISGILYYECSSCDNRVKVSNAWDYYKRHMEDY